MGFNSGFKGFNVLTASLNYSKINDLLVDN
jgi:hypothetical protein